MRCRKEVTNSMALLWEDARVRRGMTAQLAARRARLVAGERPLGWKLGFGAPAAMERFRIGAPLVGYLMKTAQLPSGADVRLDTWVKPVVEPEIAIHIGTDVVAGSDHAAAAAAIAALGPALELADMDIPPDDPEAILRGNIFQRHVILGEHDASRAGGATAGLFGRVFRRGAETAQTAEPEAMTGKLPDLVRHVADLLGAFGERLRAGDVIIAGSVVPPLFVEPNEAEIAFALEPIDRISVSVIY